MQTESTAEVSRSRRSGIGAFAMLVLIAIPFVGGITAGVMMEGTSIAKSEPAEDHEQSRRTDSGQLPAVSVSQVRKAKFVDRVLVAGTVVAREEVHVSPEIEGLRVKEIRVEEGTKVKKGDLLAVLDSEALRSTIAQSKAMRARAAATVSQARQQIAQAEAVEKEAQSTLNRAKPLKRSGVIAKSQFEKTETAATTTKAQLQAAREGLRIAQADEQQINAQGTEAEWRKSRTEIRAPVEGIIGQKNARLGGIATAAAGPMFTIIPTGDLEIEAELTDVELLRIHVGDKASIEMPDSKKMFGQVRLIAPEIDKRTRLGRIRISLERRGDLRVGAFVRGEVETASHRGLAIPSTALLYDRDGAFAQAVEDDRIATRRVVTGSEDNQLVEIKKGLSENEVVVTKAGSFLRNGDPVKPVLADKTVSGAGS